ncbi:17-beta-hydroxysteroid dehydrogenase 13-like isoform X2 [Tubulanus polymorphus]|uniref:17-beta-hydroxysteroid dehydrogenase 13-like isoform X2 n=1 Tax=Tubulanus polymorphus TaxID=672921 RepID=UPI003DA280DE
MASFDTLKTACIFLLDVFALLVRCIAAVVLEVLGLVWRKPRSPIRGDIALVTGGGHGIGREICRILARYGAQVAILDINKSSADKTVTLIASEGGSAIAYKCDVTNYDEVQHVAAQVTRDMGRVNILVNNAGILHGLDIISLNEQQIKNTFNVNNIAQFWTLKTFLPDMLSANYGYIMNIASMAGYHATSYLTDYCASKFAVRGFTLGLEHEIRVCHKKDYVHVTGVYPMFVDTGMTWYPKSRRLRRFYNGSFR